MAAAVGAASYLGRPGKSCQVTKRPALAEAVESAVQAVDCAAGPLCWDIAHSQGCEYGHMIRVASENAGDVFAAGNVLPVGSAGADRTQARAAAVPRALVALFAVEIATGGNGAGGTADGGKRRTGEDGCNPIPQRLERSG